MNQNFRIEKDSMGELRVPSDALYGAQTQRAIENFPISDVTLPKSFIQALGLIKATAATVNQELGLLDEPRAHAIRLAAQQVMEGLHYPQFPLDVFQTGSGTSSNMNANEVIAHLATQQSQLAIHPNDHVNMGQSSNDVIPTAIHLSAALSVHSELLPALTHLETTITKKAAQLSDVVKTGRTHLMDAMPLTFGQELSGWAKQMRNAIIRIQSTQPRLCTLAQGGTAVGTGINAHPEFGRRFAAELAKKTQLPFTSSDNYFESLSCQDTAVELSGQLRTLAVSLMKISNDLRWMNSGPLTGLGEIALPALQPGSSIMPGKVNPVIPEAVCMVCAQVMGNDTTIAIGGQSGNFQLNVMLPVIAYNLLNSIHLLANACKALANSAIAEFSVNSNHINEKLDKNPILVTALNAVIGYEQGAAIAKRAYKEGRAIREVAKEMTSLSDNELAQLLDPTLLTQGGIRE